MSDAADWQRVTALFDEVVDISTAERERVFAGVTTADAAVVREVRSLLSAHHAADGRLDRPSALRFSPATVAAFSAIDPVLSVGRIGAFNIVRKIGEGGMGAVYEATRADAMYEQRVAIKTIARGADNAIIAARFRRERQILAGLQHPNIAVLLDGGVTEFGTPYFVMEYVDGLPIDQWCREHRLSIAARLDLMQQVCRGVQHAHQRMVVHRDLKPQNVFVSHDGVVKLLDFGIAKLYERVDTDRESGAGDMHDVTQDGPSPLTAAYASPEHLRGDAVSTASDVYSLGVILYELLADVPPYPRSGRTAVQLAHDVLATEPPAPSVACTEDAAHACGVSDRRHLANELSGELDAIVMMAMRKEPERRYHSAEALGADLQRYLKRLPVAARPDTLAYRAQRFVRRHRWPVALATMLIVVAMIAGIAVWRQSSLARLEARRTARVAAFLQGVLGSADVRMEAGVMPRLGPNVSTSVLLDSALRRVATEFPDDPAVRARLYLTIGSSRLSQSRMRAASEVLDSAIVLSRLAGDTTSDAFVLAHLNAGSAELHGNRLAAARALTQTAERTLVARGDTASELYAHALGDLSAIAMVTGAYDTMTTLAQRALAVETRRTATPTIAKGVALKVLGIAAMLNDKWSRGDSLMRESSTVLAAVVSPSNLDRVDAELQRITIALHFSRVTVADSLIRDGLRNAAATFGERSREYAMFQTQRAELSLAQGNGAAAREASDEATHIIDSIPDVLAVVRASTYLTRAGISSNERQWTLSDSLLRRARTELRELPRGLPIVNASLTHAFVLTHLGRVAEADSAFARAERAYAATPMTIRNFATLLHIGRAYLYDRAGDSTAFARALALVPETARAGAMSFVAAQRAIDARAGH